MKPTMFNCGLFLVLILINEGYAYKCYTCASCDEIEDDTPTTEGNSCTKTTIEVLGKKMVTRGPLPTEADDKCSEVAGQQICNCKADYCNSAFTNTAMLLPLLGSLAIHQFL